MMDDKDPFKHIEPTEEMIPHFEAVADAISKTYWVVKEHTTQSREQSLAITKLQEARMWANAAISFQNKAVQR